MDYSKIDSIPFLTVGIYNNEEYIGIIGNSDDQITSFYSLSNIPDSDLRKEFLKVGEEWWWETNRLLPINISMKDKWKKFQPYLKNFFTKEFEVKSGPIISLDNVINKKTKRKQIQLVRKLK